MVLKLYSVDVKDARVVFNFFLLLLSSSFVNILLQGFISHVMVGDGNSTKTFETKSVIIEILLNKNKE